MGFNTVFFVNTFSIDVSFTTAKLILTKLERFLFSGYEQTEFWNPHMETCRRTKIPITSKFKIRS